MPGAVDNRFEVEWKRDAQGAVERLRQQLEVGRGTARRELIADYDRLRDVTMLTIDEASAGRRKLELPGLVLLRLTVAPGGGLTPGYGLG